MLVALGLVAWAAPVEACEPGGVTEVRWTFTEHAAGMPASSEPARTLDGAALYLRYSSVERLWGDVTLAAAPTAETEAALVVAFGNRLGDGSCSATSTTVVSTHSPEGGVVRDGATLTFDLRMELPSRPDCAWIAVTGHGQDGVQHDRMDGVPRGALVSDPARLEVSAQGSKRVPVGRWVAVRVDMWVPCYVDRIRLVGKGRGLDTRRVRVGTPGADYYRVRLPVRLNRARVARLRVLATGFDARGREVSMAKAFIKLRPQG
ncbi:hypothetical protein ACFP3Q_07845 [Nocardioides sp. GCM10027113]|uniref:hypothetical protein n=1 Tax=unclassified Nocardioides TaxID=2615069 RepID=UPI003609D49D